MAREKRYYVYIMASISGVLYVGVTGFLYARILQHKSGETDGFTRRYRVHKLVYYATFRYVNNALERETEIKKWRREKKIALIEARNPAWQDLAAEVGRRDTSGQSPLHGPAAGAQQIPPASATLGVGMTRVEERWLKRGGGGSGVVVVVTPVSAQRSVTLERNHRPILFLTCSAITNSPGVFPGREIPAR